MELRPLMTDAAEAAIGVVRGIDPANFGDPTPCAEYDVRALLNHHLLWTGRAETAARKEPATGPEEGHDFTADPGWADLYADLARRAAAAWSEPAAWEGRTRLSPGGDAADGMPADYIGGILFGEFLLHGWDLAVATGRRPDYTDGLVAGLYEQLRPTADMARQYGVFGPEVVVPETAPLLDKALGLSGRDPAWSPGRV